MENQQQPYANQSEPVRTGAHLFGDWVSVEEAILICTDRGLHRTPKTIRKWAARSADVDPTLAEITVRKQDTSNGQFRYQIERVSLERKIEQELELLKAKQRESDQTPEEGVRTGLHPSAPVQTGAANENIDEPGANPTTPVRTGSHLFGAPEFLLEQLAEKDRQLAEKDEQLKEKDRQIERKDAHLDAMIERDRETNILMSTLQTTLGKTLGIEAPQARAYEPRAHDQGEGDNAAHGVHERAVE